MSEKLIAPLWMDKHVAVLITICFKLIIYPFEDVSRYVVPVATLETFLIHLQNEISARSSSCA